jgi:hypothetical protein
MVGEMANRRMYSFYLDADLLKGLKTLKTQVGVSESETIRRAVRAWLTQHGSIKAASRRAQTRRKA